MIFLDTDLRIYPNVAIVIGTPQRGMGSTGWKNNYVASTYVNLNAASVIDLPEEES